MILTIEEPQENEMTTQDHSPLISCLMVTPASEERLSLLKASIQSYISQTHENKELVIVVDNSKENKIEHLLSYLSALNRQDIRCVIPPRKLCLGGLRNISMTNANGEILCQWDDDDLSHPERVAAQVRFLKDEHYDAAILTDNLHVFQYAQMCYWESGKHNLIGGRPCTLMVRSNHGLEYPESGRESMRGEDREFLNRLKTKFNVGYFEAPSFHYIYFFHGHNTMDPVHHRKLAMKTAVSDSRVVANREFLIEGIQQIVGFDFPNLRMMGKKSTLFTWSRSGNSIVFEEIKAACRGRKIVAFPSGNRVSALASPLESGLSHPITVAARALKRMKNFKPLDEHVWDLLAKKRILPSEASTVREFLKGLADEGFLISEQELKAKIASHDEEDAKPGASIESFAVPTCGRPETLLRCITSFLENFRKHNRRPRVIIADDSASPSQQSANLAHLRMLNTTFPEFKFSYAGFAEKRRYAKTLARHAGVEPSIIEFALFNPENLVNKACGPNRNALFLETVGECFLSADDDVICRPCASQDISDSIHVTTAKDPTRVHLFPDQISLLSHQDASDSDLIGLHDEVLGKSLGSIFRSEPSTPVTFGRLNDRFLNIIEKRAIRARVSWNGIYGDPGSTYPTYYLWKDKITYAELTSNEETYHNLSMSRQIFRAPNRLTFGAGGYCQSTIVAYDHRTVLPPFMPLRGLDIVFGKMLTRLCPSLIAYLPWALFHVPPVERSISVEYLKEAGSSIPYYAVLGLILATYPISECDSDIAASLKKCGTYLSEIGSLPGAEFEDLVRTQLWKSVSRRVESLERQLRKRPRAPRYWSDDIRTHIETLRKSQTPAGFCDAILRNGMGFDQRIALAQRLTERFGRLLHVWPTLIEAAAELKAREIRLASPLLT